MALPIVQFVGRPGVLDLGWGHPHPDALPATAWVDAVAAATRRHGWQALTYGYSAGPAPLIDWLCARLATTDAAPPEPGEVFVTAGASHALHLVATLSARRGDTAIVAAPTYHLALRILADHGLDAVAAPSDGEGIDPDATGELIHRLHRAGRRVGLIYLVPTFANPTGANLHPQRRAALGILAAAAGVLIVEDDTYRELSYAGPAPASLFATAPRGAVARIGSFAKSVAPGLRLGFVTAAAPLVARLANLGYVDSGGGVNHTTAVAMAEFGASGVFAAHVEAVRARYAHQRDVLAAAVRTHLPGADFAVPDGGWFLWVRAPTGAPVGPALLAAAERAGVSYLPGDRFHPDGAGADHLRLSFSMLGPEDLAEAVRRLATALS